MIIYTDLNFKHKLMKLRNFTVYQVINESGIHDIVKVKGLVYNLKYLTNVSKKLLHLKKGMIKDDQNKNSLVLFDAIIYDVENNNTMNLKIESAKGYE